ncbi:hypothetical protein JQX13_31425 [Archangium violaceum]|nr:hypothetical protein JQX13_31425 [Archangium violaceum]
MGCTRAYIQKVGLYEFKAVELIRDDCGMLAFSPEEALWDGELLIFGEVVRMRYGLQDALLVGRFLDGSASDNDVFSMDGSVANVSLPGDEEARCFVDQLKLHMEGTTQCDRQFDGVLSVRYEQRIQQPGCACQLWVRYQAVEKGKSPCYSSP